jgi:hypothetical protein
MKRIVFNILIVFTTCTAFSHGIVDEQYQEMFIVIADTSNDYNQLRTNMFRLSNDLNLTIDTLGRGYDRDKKLICLPIDDSDDIYAGEYAPRRYPSNTLSLEYLTYYLETYDQTNKTIALVAAISENEGSATNILNKVKSISKNAYILEASVYMGCMH